MAMGKNVSKYRKLKRWSQADLARAAGLSRGYISAIEEGSKIPRPKTIAIIAACLGVGMENLIRED